MGLILRINNGHDGDAGNTGNSSPYSPVERTLSIAADTWVDFPDAGLDYSYYEIYQGDIESRDSFLIREQNGVSQIRSSIAYSNLKFIFYV